MSGFNKVTSFVLGLIVVLVFLFVFGSRVNLTDKLLAFKDSKVTPSPSSVQAPTPTPKPKKGFFESLFGRKVSPAGQSPLGGATPTPRGARIVEDNTHGETVFTNPPTTSSMTAQPQTIPQTGSPTILLPILISALGSGLYLRKKN